MYYSDYRHLLVVYEFRKIGNHKKNIIECHRLNIIAIKINMYKLFDEALNDELIDTMIREDI